jgi:hypothetical protein
LILPKNGGSVAFVITGQIGSDDINDATIRALIDDPGPPVFEEDVTVYWYDTANIDIDVHGTYGIAQARDKDDKIIPNMHVLTCVPSAVTTTPFSTVAVFMKGKAMLHPDFGTCIGPEEIEQTRIAIVQNCRDFETVTEYHDPLVLWEAYGPQSIIINNSIRVTDRFPDAYTGQWVIDGGVLDKPLYDRNFDLLSPSHTVIRPPAPCPFSDFSFTLNSGESFSDSGTWYNDTPSSMFYDTWPPPHRPPIPIVVDGLVVAHVRYMRFGKVAKKENFRTWVVTYWRELPYNTSGGPEEIIPLREIEWSIDLDTSALDINGMPILESHQAKAWDSDIETLNFPVITGPAANEFQPSATDPALRPPETTEYFNGTTTVYR